MDELVEVYRPLCEEVGAEYISIQVAALNPEAMIGLLGREVLPRLHKLAPAAVVR